MSGHLVVLSGGLDSTVCMALASRESGSSPLALTFDYGQRHRTELDRSAGVAGHYRSEHLVVALDTSAWGGSALTDPSIDVPVADADGGRPDGRDGGGVGGGAGRDGGAAGGGVGGGIPVTYVPARNSIFLAVALGVAEARGLDAVWIGVNAIDYSGYPDCRPEFIEAFRGVAATGQKRGVEGDPIAIRTPLIESTKADIVRMGLQLGAPLAMTWSCYRGGEVPCGTCDACALRARGFADAGVDDPALR
jgi:7-cyano-7-deazaguanine synthase